MSSPTQLRLPQRRVEKRTGTALSIDVRRPGVVQAVIESTVRRLHWVDDIFWPSKGTSQIPGRERDRISAGRCAPEVREIFRRCDELSPVTAVFFAVWVAGSVDPSGLIKGWAIQRASDLSAVEISANHYVLGGAGVQCVGDPAPDRQRRVGIAHSMQSEQLAPIVAGDNLAVATAGIAECVCHIPDLRTGDRPTDPASATLVDRHLATLDAYANRRTRDWSFAPGWIESPTGCAGCSSTPIAPDSPHPGFARSSITDQPLTI